MSTEQELAWAAALDAFGECQTWVFRNDVVNDPYWRAAWEFLKLLHAAVGDVDFRGGRFSVQLKRPIDDFVCDVMLELARAIERNNAPVFIAVEDGKGGRMRAGLQMENDGLGDYQK